MANQRFLMICETFYSIQGEGKSAGVPSVFLRLAGCNLQCSGFSYQDPLTGEHLGCDSKQLWRHGQHAEMNDIIDDWQQNNWLHALNNGAHLVISGGEPLLQQTAVLAFIEQLDARLSRPAYIEIETNATVAALPALLVRINQFNLSPKLAHSGELAKKAYKPAVLQQFLSLEKAVFKFVVATPNDVDELIARYVQVFDIAPQRVWLMPEGGTQAAINAKKAWIIERCKQHVFNFSSRLQVDVWGEVVGV